MRFAGDEDVRGSDGAEDLPGGRHRGGVAVARDLDRGSATVGAPRIVKSVLPNGARDELGVVLSVTHSVAAHGAVPGRPAALGKRTAQGEPVLFLMKMRYKKKQKK